MNSYWKSLKPFATAKQWEKIELSQKLGSNSKAADQLGIDRRGLDRAIESVIEKATAGGILLDKPVGLRILSVDIETAPIMGYVWSLWSEMRSTKAVESDWYLLSYSYKWLDNEDVLGKSLFTGTRYGKYKTGTENDRELIEDLWELMNEADIIVAHNGDKFDVKKIKARMLMYGMDPPAPFRSVDTLKICKREFGLTSNRLDAIAEALLGEGKMDTGGMDLWIACLKGDEQAWEHMLDYNIRDVQILEDVYKKIRAWDRSHPNVAVNFTDGVSRCTVCTSDDIRPMGDKTADTNVSSFQAHRCGNCGHVMRGRANLRPKEALNATLLNAR